MTDDADLFGEDAELDAERALDAVADPTTYKWEGTLLTMLDAVRLALKKQRVDPDEIARLAPPVTMGLCDAIGGNVGYIPRGEAVRRALRNARLYDDWSGSPTERSLTPPELARKYGLAQQTVYEIIAKQKVIRRRAEPDLFGIGEGEKE